MPVIRAVKSKNFTTVDNGYLKNKNMSLKAKGLLTVVMSLDDDWQYSVSGLVSICKEGRKAVEGAMKELKDEGYLVINKLMPNETKSGRIEYEYLFHEIKQDPPFQGLENQGLENQGLENQVLEKDEQLNTNKSNTDNKKTKRSNTNDQLEEEFESMWALYPNKRGKQKAKQAYIKARKEGIDAETIKAGVEEYANYVKSNSVDQQYVKHGSTFFNGRCWEDEYQTRKQSTTVAKPSTAFDAFGL